jgi:molybdopterin converting factor small subunit
LNIEVRLFATFRLNRGKKVYVEQEAPTPKSILESLDIFEDDIAILLINGRDGDYEMHLSEGDYLSVFPPVGGG